MKMHSIDVDDEVFEYLKAKAEPFVDTPNSVLRRELLSNKNISPPTVKLAASNTLMPTTPLGTPKALEQILEVAFLVRNSGKTRLDATHYVAKKHGVAFQTVLDKYCRQMDLTAYQFDTLLGQEDLRDLKKLLRKKFNDHASFIETCLYSK